MSRSVNRKGWGSAGVTAEALNTAIPFSMFYLPAGMWVPAFGQPAIWTPGKQINAQTNEAFDCWEFEHSVNREIYCDIKIAGLPINITTPAFRVLPTYFQDVGAAPAPAEECLMEYTIGNNNDGSSTDYTLEGAQEVQKLSEIPAAWIDFSTGATFDESISIPTTDGPDGLSATLGNNLRFQLERFGTDGSDDYLQTVFFRGMAVQYATDFNNVNEFPS